MFTMLHIFGSLIWHNVFHRKPIGSDVIICVSRRRRGVVGGWGVGWQMTFLFSTNNPMDWAVCMLVFNCRVPYVFHFYDELAEHIIRSVYIYISIPSKHTHIITFSDYYCCFRQTSKMATHFANLCGCDHILMCLFNCRLRIHHPAIVLRRGSLGCNNNWHILRILFVLLFAFIYFPRTTRIRWLRTRFSSTTSSSIIIYLTSKPHIMGYGWMDGWMDDRNQPASATRSHTAQYHINNNNDNKYAIDNIAFRISPFRWCTLRINGGSSQTPASTRKSGVLLFQICFARNAAPYRSIIIKQ